MLTLITLYILYYMIYIYRCKFVKLVFSLIKILGS